MFKIFRRNPRRQQIRSVSRSLTLIGVNSDFNGRLKVEGTLHIDGSLDGDLLVSGHLVISESARVSADIRAQTVSIAGTVKGTIAAEKVELLTTGRVQADLAAYEFTSSEGSQFSGEVTLLE